MTKALYRHNLSTEFPVAARGAGVYLIDSAGRRYLDASCGAAVSCLGHSNERVRAAVTKQIGELEFAHTRFFTNEPMERLAEDLISDAPSGLTKVFFGCGGSEAIEAALKLTRQYFMEIGEPQRRHVIARRQSYHGATAGALSASGNLARRAQFEPLLLPAARHISPCFAYRDRKEGETEAEYGLRVADELEAEILRLGPANVAAFVAETVVGSTLGCVPAVPGYFKRIREICDRYGVLLILDEVMCGMGRTGTRYACEQERITADFIAIAKGLSGGYLPLGGVLINEKIHKAIEAGSNVVMHSHTYSGHPMSCAAALAVQEEIRSRDLLANVRSMGRALKAALDAKFGDHPYVGDIRGRGLFLALELVADRGTKEPFDPALKLASRILEAGMRNGLICYPMGGVIDGRRGENVMLAPPFIIDESHVGEMVEKLGRTLDEVLPAGSRT